MAHRASSGPDPSRPPLKRASESSFMSYNATPNEGYFTSPTAYHSSPPSAYEFSILSRDSLVPAEESPSTYEHNGGSKTDAAYHRIGGVDEQPPSGQGRPKTLLAWVSFYFSCLHGLLWIVPVVALIILNIKEYRIGASAWCPNGYCPAQSADATMSTKKMTAKYEINTKNLIGALQFAAKAAEVWFMLIAVSLVYQVTSLLARSSHGLPIGYLTAYVEFTDLLYLVKRTLWSTPLSAPGQRGQKRKRRILRYYFFGLFVAFTCIIANLVGPLVAVLMIPTLNWRESHTEYKERYGSLLADKPPSGDNIITGCSAANFSAHEYDCTLSYYQSSLDSLIDYANTDLDQFSVSPAHISQSPPASSREQGLAIRFNFTQSEDGNPNSLTTNWAPSRLIARTLTADLSKFYDPGDDDSALRRYNNSVQLTLQRRGPILGVQGYFYPTNATFTVVGPDKGIRCYRDCYVDTQAQPAQSYAKCFRVGSGWSASGPQEVLNFTVGSDKPANGTLSNVYNSSNPVTVTTFYSDHSAWFATKLLPGQDMPPCLPNGSAPTDGKCDYDALFTAPAPAAIPSNLTYAPADRLVSEYTVANDPDFAIMHDMHFWTGFTTYAADVSFTSPDWGIIAIDSFPDNSTWQPVTVHPAWLLAAWSVAPGGNVPWQRNSARTIRWLTTFLRNAALAPYTDELFAAYQRNMVLWGISTGMAATQAASFVPYASSPLPDHDDAPGLAADDAARPQLWTNVRRQVWGYGLDTRTSKLAVAALGVAVVLALLRTGLMLATRVRLREPGELLVAAMKHQPKGEFRAAGGRQVDEERVRFVIADGGHEHMHFRKADAQFAA